jgi:hypothetical protein
MSFCSSSAYSPSYSSHRIISTLQKVALLAGRLSDSRSHLLKPRSHPRLQKPLLEHRLNTPSPPNATTSTSPSGQSSATTPSAPAAKTAVATTITSVQQNEHSLRVDTTLNTSTNAGTCTLTLTGPPAHPLTETSNVQANGTTSSCVGFDIPIAQLSPGEWQINLSFENDSHTGTAFRTVVVH